MNGCKSQLLPVIECFLFISMDRLILNGYEYYRVYEFAKNHINGIEWSFAKPRLAQFNKISNGLKSFIFMNFDGITKIQICIKFY